MILKKNDNLSIATLLDPRLKDKFFSSPAVKTRVESSVCALTSSLQPEESSSVDPHESPRKRPCTELWKIIKMERITVEMN